MATYVTSRRMFVITLMITLALTAVARPMLAADNDVTDLVPEEPRVMGALPRGVTPGPTGSILDSARRHLSRQVASRAEQERGATEKSDSLWNGTRNGAIIGAIAQVVLAEVYGGTIARNEGTYTFRNAARAYAINGAIGGAIGAGIGALVDWAR